MNTVVTAVLALLLGAAGGLAFFGGLAATVRRLPTSRRPAALVLVSALGRSALVAVTLTAAALMGPVPLLAGIAGTLAIRWLVLRRTPTAR